MHHWNRSFKHPLLSSELISQLLLRHLTEWYYSSRDFNSSRLLARFSYPTFALQLCASLSSSMNLTFFWGVGGHTTIGDFRSHSPTIQLLHPSSQIYSSPLCTSYLVQPLLHILKPTSFSMQSLFPTTNLLSFLTGKVEDEIDKYDCPLCS